MVFGGGEELVPVLSGEFDFGGERGVFDTFGVCCSDDRNDVTRVLEQEGESDVLTRGVVLFAEIAEKGMEFCVTVAELRRFET